MASGVVTLVLADNRIEWLKLMFAVAARGPPRWSPATRSTLAISIIALGAGPVLSMSRARNEGAPIPVAEKRAIIAGSKRRIRAASATR